ncbi:MAG: hypothetical protein N3A59_08650 [Thermodesulfovibrionales bacterium]|nr:hypothetical protein [Thermodesulfovibrionales bacterium]
MKKLLYLLFFLIALGIFYKIFFTISNIKDDRFAILLVYNPKLITKCDYVVKAYESVLQEEGVPFKKISYEVLASYKTDLNFILKHPGLILPDCAMQWFNEDFLEWFKEYVNGGGSIFISYDVGVKDRKGAYQKEAAFSDLLGINYCLYDKLKDKAYTVGRVKIIDPKFLGISPGKIEKENMLISGYIYGSLYYPTAEVEIRNWDIKSFAQIFTEDKKSFTASALKEIKKGKIFWVNLPLGHLKAYSDDFIMRSFLTTFLFKIIQIPHIVNTPHAKGGLVINWHIDANSDWKTIPFMIEKGYLLKEMLYSFHITAGDFRDHPGDNLGFDACGKGKELVKLMLQYGEIGSHGGWAHNYFSQGILENKFNVKDTENYIIKNIKCLETLTNYPLKEYSAPNGVHPQPIKTKILKKLGIIAYYYSGDSGSAPNRTFFDGAMVERDVIAFPTLSYQKFASFHEMWKGGVSEKEVESFLLDILNYVVYEKTIRLFYSHPYDLPYYSKALKVFLEKAKDLIKKELLEINTMRYFAEFLLRFLETEYSFNINSHELKISLKNKKGLQHITVAVPKRYTIIYPRLNLKTKEDDYYKYFIINGNLNEINLIFSINNQLPKH